MTGQEHFSSFTGGIADFNLVSARFMTAAKTPVLSINGSLTKETITSVWKAIQAALSPVRTGIPQCKEEIGKEEFAL